MWYCVIDFQTLRILYHGTKHADAAAASTPTTYTANGAGYGSSLRKAAMGAGYRRRDLPVPELGPREPGLGD